MDSITCLFLTQGLLAIIHLAKKEAVCFDLGQAGAVQVLADVWSKWPDQEMRQLILWAMDTVARLGETTEKAAKAGCRLVIIVAVIVVVVVVVAWKEVLCGRTPLTKFCLGVWYRGDGGDGGDFRG